MQGFTTITSKDNDYKVGDLVILFNCDGQLSEEYAERNNLVMKKLEDGTRDPNSGYLEEKRRIRALKLRGQKSECLIMPLESVAYTNFDISKLVEGFQFTELNGHPICNHYYSEATLRHMRGEGAPVRTVKRGETAMFKKMVDIDQFRLLKGSIPEGSIIWITEKLHGTSHRIANTLDEMNPTTWEKIRAKLVSFLGIETRFEGYKILNGSRNVILETSEARNSWYGTDVFRYRAVNGVVPHKGETIYGEIVGWVDINSPIMPRHDLTKLKDKSLLKQYNNPMVYTYGTPDGEAQFFVYRITQTGVDGNVQELTYPQIAKRCRELGLKQVPLLDNFIYDGDVDALSDRVDKLVNGTGMECFPSTLDNTHIQEGVVVSYLAPDGRAGFMKHKNFAAFLVLEGIVKDDDTVLDIEESS